jgi:hypothetical protein
MSDRASWLLYLVGSLLVFGSWIDLVPNDLGWFGWLMALAGWAVGTRRYRWDHPQRPVSIPEQIEKLDALRQRNVITDEEFQLQKRRLLERP